MDDELNTDSVPSSSRSIRLISCGDQLLAGTGDPRALGWLGRVLARTDIRQVNLSSYTLARPYEGTEALAQRWLPEVKLRLSEEAENRLILALSAEDINLGVGTARSRLHLANILDAASHMNMPTLVVGPPPSANHALNERIAELSAAFGDVTNRRRTPYIDTFSPLMAHGPWLDDLAAHGGVPGQSGYGLLAWVVLNRGWHTWLQVHPLAN